MAKITQKLIASDVSGERKAECLAHLDTLMALAQSKSQYYAEKINTGLLGAGQGTNKTFPISTIQSFIYQTKAYTSKDASNISTVINESIKGFVSGDITSAVTTIVSGFVNTLFGSSEASECEKIEYCAILEGVSMIRLDFAGWSRSVTSSALQTNCERVSAFVLYRSIVDMNKISINDFTSVYQYTVKAENPNFKTAEIVNTCHELYYLFNPENKPDHMLKASVSPLGEEMFQPSIGHESLDVFKKDLTTL
jgi:hypothetical protein